MSDDDQSKKQTTDIELELQLEPPPAAESPTASFVNPAQGTIGASLFGDETVLATAGRFAVVEAFLRQLARDQSFSDFTREILMAIMRIVKCEAGSLLEVDHARNALFFRSVAGVSSDRVSNFVIPMGQGIVGHVAESRRPLVVQNVAESKIHLKAIQDAVGFDTRNLIAVPILIRGRIYGVLELLNRIGEPEFTPADIELLTYACEMAAKAIEVRLMIAWARRGKDGKAA